MTIVSLTDFNVPPLDLANLTTGNFNAFRDQEEQAILRQLLGDEMYEDFIAEISADWSAATTYALNDFVASGNSVYKSIQAANTNHPVTDGVWWVLDHADDKWLLLKNGSTYVYREVTYKYTGLKPLMVPYVYSRWTEVKADRNTGLGIVKSKTENADVVSSSDRVSSSWQMFARLVGVVRLDEQFDPRNSLAGFLFVNPTLYEDWIFISPGRKNVFNF